MTCAVICAEFHVAKGWKDMVLYRPLKLYWPLKFLNRPDVIETGQDNQRYGIHAVLDSHYSFKWYDFRTESTSV